MEFVFQNHKLKDFRKSLRSNSTNAEKTLWNKLRKKQLAGYRFQRQYSVNNYILDFYCPKKRLGIELDGGHHAESDQALYDDIRTKSISKYGIKVIRFWNIDIYNRIDKVLETIFTELEQR